MSSSGSEEGGAELPGSSPTSPIRIEPRGTEWARMEPEGPRAEHPSPLDLIFSCTICQATVAHLYAENEQGKGLKRTANSNERVIPKLWLAECAHVTCGKHLDGGGAPFHPEGQAPRAPCPLCSAENGDKSPKALFAINGYKKGEYDVQIPDNYFLIPPMQLGGEDAGLQAMRFQYLALVRYGTKMHATIKHIELQMKTSQLGERLNAAMIDSLKVVIAKQGRSVKYWADRQAQITHCLKSFPLLANNLHEARRTLIGLNQDVSSIDQAFAQIVGPSSRAPAQQRGTGIIPASTRIDTVPSSDHRGESRFAQASIADLEALNSRPEALAALSEFTRVVQAPQIQEASPKRKHVDSASDAVDDARHVRGGKAFQCEESAIAMPRPMRLPKIVSNMHAYASPSHRGHIDPADPFLDYDVHAEHAVMAPGFTQDATQNYSASERSQDFETGGDYRLPAVHDRYSTMKFNDQNGQYNDIRCSVAETSRRNPDKKELDRESFHIPWPRFEQRVPSTAALNQSYPGQQSSYEQRPSTTTLNRSYLGQQSSFEQTAQSTKDFLRSYLGQTAPSTAALNQSYLGQQSSFEQRPSTTTLNRSYLGQQSSFEQTAQSTKDFLRSYLGQTAPSTATLNRAYLGQQSSSEQRASNTATLNRTNMPQQSSFEQRAPSTKTFLRSYLSEQSSVEQRASNTANLDRSNMPKQSSSEQTTSNTATLNRSNVPQQPSFEQKAPSTKGFLRSYLSEQSSVEQRDPITATLDRLSLPQQSHFEDRRTTTATTSRNPFRAPTIQKLPSNLYPTGYTTNPHATRPSNTHLAPPNSLSHRHTTTSNDASLSSHHCALPTSYVSPDRRLTFPPHTSHLTRTTPYPHRSHRGLTTNARSSSAQMPTLAPSHRAPLDPHASPSFGRGAMTANQQIWNGLSFVSDPSTAGAGAGHPRGGRRNVRR